MTILVAVDFSVVTGAAVKEAGRLAQSLGEEIILLHAAAPEPDFVGYEAGPQVVRHQVAEEYAEEHRALQALAEDLRGTGHATKALLVQGPSAEVILGEAEKCDASMIVLGSHGRSAVYTILLGSIAEAVVNKATRPVLLVPAGAA